MSLILDALRKSEAQRRRGQLPALSLELPPTPARRSPGRAWWIALPVGVALAGLAIWRIGPDEPGPPPASTPAPAAEQAPVREPPPPATTVAPAANPVPAAPAAVPLPAPVAPSPVVRDTPAAGAIGEAGVVAFSDLPPDERRALPPLKLSMHLWSEDPARRFVILDGHRLSEGDRAGNAVVERIDPAGVILAADGRRIRLPLP